MEDGENTFVQLPSHSDGLLRLFITIIKSKIVNNTDKDGFDFVDPKKVRL